MPNFTVSGFRSGVLWTTAILACAAAIGAVGADISRRAAGMKPGTMASAMVLAATPGTTAKAVVRLERPDGQNSYAAELLESSDGAVWRDTTKRLRIILAGNTAVAMGGASDVRPGAIVEASGAMDTKHALHAARVVILTGYVHVARGE
jgi:hypothetical protein